MKARLFFYGFRLLNMGAIEPDALAYEHKQDAFVNEANISCWKNHLKDLWMFLYSEKALYVSRKKLNAFFHILFFYRYYFLLK